MPKVSKAVKQFVQKKLDANEEDKVYLTDQLNAGGAAGIVSNSVGSFANLCGMAQGTTSITRIGNRIKPKSLDVWVRGRTPLDTNGASQIVRTIIFMDHDVEAVQPILGDLFGTGINTANAVTAGYDAVNIPKRFTIMLDRRMHLSAGSGVVDSWHHRFSAKQLRMITFNGQATIIGKGVIRALNFSEIPAGSANLPEVGINSRLVYEDA